MRVAKPAPCVCATDRALLDALVQRAATDGGVAGDGCATPHAKYSFYPMGGTLWEDLRINNFNDLDPGSGALDFRCSNWTYGGHDATDTEIRSFGEQVIGVPVFAAMDGVVLASADGHADMNTQALGQPANFCSIDHGAGRIAHYYHFAKDSVLVQAGDVVVAGQQIGKVGSSGNSTWPHLHFATYDNGQRFEPFAGACREGESGWHQQPPVPTTLLVTECGFSRTSIGVAPPPPTALPRTGHFGFNESTRQFWMYANNLPANATFDIRTIRPDGTLAAQGDFSAGNASSYRWSWWWMTVPFHSQLTTLPGTWSLEVRVNGALAIAAPFEVKPTYDPSFNRVPAPIGLGFDPPAPRQDQVIFCRVQGPLAIDDLDYDIVRYEYLWTVDGEVVRHETTAGRADAIPRTFAAPGAVVACTVTPMDGVAAGQPAMVTIVVDDATFDCNANQVDDAVDIASGASADDDGDGVPDECQTPVLYVDADAGGLGHGTSWTGAYPDLQQALFVARHRSDVTGLQVWVAAGTYVPDASCGDRTVSFDLVDGVQVLGGFAGWETDARQRDASANPTILSGDLAGDDGPDFANRTDNAYHVVRAGAVGAAAILDGFVVTGGFADGSTFEWSRGAGAWIEFGTPTIRNCTFVDNRCTQYGGAVHAQAAADPLFQWCLFEGNVAGNGGAAVQTFNCGIRIEDSIIRANGFPPSSGEGAGVRSHGGTCALVRCTIEDNTAWHAAGLKHVGGTLAIEDCVVRGNISMHSAGALSASAPFNAIDTVFEDNHGFGWDAGAVWLFSGATALFDGCAFTSNTCLYNGGALQSDAPMLLRDCTFTDNQAGGDGGAMRLVATEAAVDIVGCTFMSNVSAYTGGAIAAYDQPNLSLSHCTFTDNATTFGGGAVVLYQGTGKRIDNCLFRGNSAAFGGAMYNLSNAVDVVGCTFADNVAGNGSGGGIGNLGTAATDIRNCILWGNVGGQIAATGADTVSYSVVQGGFSGPHNQYVDPKFRDPANGDYRLSCDSPAIDAADNTALTGDGFDLDEDGDLMEQVPVDLVGNARRIDDPTTFDIGNGAAPVVDCGAFEFELVAIADLSGDGVLDGADLGVLLALWGTQSSQADYNCDGVVNGADLGFLLAELW